MLNGYRTGAPGGDCTTADRDTRPNEGLNTDPTGTHNRYAPSQPVETVVAGQRLHPLVVSGCERLSPNRPTGWQPKTQPLKHASGLRTTVSTVPTAISDQLKNLLG